MKAVRLGGCVSGSHHENVQNVLIELDAYLSGGDPRCITALGNARVAELARHPVFEQRMIELGPELAKFSVLGGVCSV